MRPEAREMERGLFARCCRHLQMDLLSASQQISRRRRCRSTGAWVPAAAGTTFFLSADEGGGIDGGGGIVITGALVLSGMGGTGGTASEVNLSVWRDQVESTEGLRLCVWLLKASAPKTAVAGDDVPSWPKVPIELRGLVAFLPPPRMTRLF